MSLPTNKIFIPVVGRPKIITNDIDEFDKLIGCKTSSGYVLNFDYFGYKLSVFVDDTGMYKNLPINRLGSILIGERGPILGNCIIIDDYKELTFDDLEKLVKIAKTIPSSNWMPEPLLDKFKQNKSILEKEDHYMFLLDSYNDALAVGTKEQRMEIWDKVKEYYVPSE